MIVISKQWSFDAAHQLENFTYSPETNDAVFGKCARLHGHTYTVEVAVNGDVNAATGMIMNYFDLDSMVKPHIERMDHHFLNDVFPDMLTTAENMVREIASWVQIDLVQRGGPRLTQVTLSETPKTKALWRP